MRYFTSERLIITHGKKGTTALVSLPKDTCKVGAKEIAKVLKRNQSSIVGPKQAIAVLRPWNQIVRSPSFDG